MADTVVVQEEGQVGVGDDTNSGMSPIVTTGATGETTAEVRKLVGGDRELIKRDEECDMHRTEGDDGARQAGTNTEIGTSAPAGPAVTRRKALAGTTAAKRPTERQDKDAQTAAEQWWREKEAARIAARDKQRQSLRQSGGGGGENGAVLVGQKIALAPEPEPEPEVEAGTEQSTPLLHSHSQRHCQQQSRLMRRNTPKAGRGPLMFGHWDQAQFKNLGFETVSEYNVHISSSRKNIDSREVALDPPRGAFLGGGGAADIYSDSTFLPPESRVKPGILPTDVLPPVHGRRLEVDLRSARKPGMHTHGGGGGGDSGDIGGVDGAGQGRGDGGGGGGSGGGGLHLHKLPPRVEGWGTSALERERGPVSCGLRAASYAPSSQDGDLELRGLLPAGQGQVLSSLALSKVANQMLCALLFSLAH